MQVIPCPLAMWVEVVEALQFPLQVLLLWLAGCFQLLLLVSRRPQVLQLSHCWIQLQTAFLWQLPSHQDVALEWIGFLAFLVFSQKKTHGSWLKTLLEHEMKVL